MKAIIPVKPERRWYHARYPMKAITEGRTMNAALPQKLNSNCIPSLLEMSHPWLSVTKRESLEKTLSEHTPKQYTRKEPRVVRCRSNTRLRDAHGQKLTEALKRRASLPAPTKYWSFMPPYFRCGPT